MGVEDLPESGGEVGVGGVLVGQGRPGAGDGLVQVARFDGLHLDQAQATRDDSTTHRLGRMRSRRARAQVGRRNPRAVDDVAALVNDE